MLQISRRTLVHAAIPLVDRLHDCSRLLFAFELGQPAASKKQRVAGDGDHLMRLVCKQQDRQSLHLQPLRCGFGNRRVYHRSAGKHILEENGWNRIHVYGHRCSLLGPCQCLCHLIYKRCF